MLAQIGKGKEGFLQVIRMRVDPSRSLPLPPLHLRLDHHVVVHEGYRADKDQYWKNHIHVLRCLQLTNKRGIFADSCCVVTLDWTEHLDSADDDEAGELIEWLSDAAQGEIADCGCEWPKLCQAASSTRMTGCSCLKRPAVRPVGYTVSFTLSSASVAP